MSVPRLILLVRGVLTPGAGLLRSALRPETPRVKLPAGQRHVALRAGAAGLVAGVLIAGGTLSAANREHQQMMADIRMLQEQTQQLQQTLGTLLDALRAVTQRLDDQTATARKAFADQRLLVDGLGSELRIVREKIDDNNVRLSSLSQEVEALRNSIPATPATALPPADPSGSPTGPEGQPTVPPPTAPVNPAAGMSPTKLWDLAYSDYAGGQWALAIQGFETYLRAFPKTEQSDDAQFYIGESFQLDGRFKEAIDAYDRVITEYANGDRVPDAYYKRGLAQSRLNQPDRARESFETVIKKYPNSPASGLAKQVLDRLGRGAGRE
jgi:tol-pal system protein YbgF